MKAGTLEDVVDDYITTARDLGNLEQQRRELDGERPGRSAFMKARHRWGRVVNLILTAADVLGTEDTEMQLLVKAVDQAKQQSLERRRQRVAHGEQAENDEVEPDDPEADDLDLDIPDSGQDQVEPAEPAPANLVARV